MCYQISTNRVLSWCHGAGGDLREVSSAGCGLGQAVGPWMKAVEELFAQVECNFPSIAIHSGLQQEDGIDFGSKRLSGGPDRKV